METTKAADVVVSFDSTNPPTSSEKQNEQKLDLFWLLRNLQRTGIAIFLAIFLAAAMAGFQGVSDNRSIRAGLHRTTALPDLLMEWAPKWMPHNAADVFLNSLMGFSILSVFVKWQRQRMSTGTTEATFRGLRLLRRFFFLLSAAYILRMISILVTTMPPSDPRCTYKQRTWRELPFVGLEIVLGLGNSCSDKVFSGHSTMATYLGLFWISALLHADHTATLANNTSASTASLESNSHLSSATKRKISWGRKAAVAYIMTHITAIYLTCVLCRNHYTIDIVVAVMVTTALYSVYMLAVRMIEIIGPEEVARYSSWRQQATYLPVSTNSPIVETDKAASPSAGVLTMKALPLVMRVVLKRVYYLDGFDLQPTRN